MYWLELWGKIQVIGTVCALMLVGVMLLVLLAIVVEGWWTRRARRKL